MTPLVILLVAAGLPVAFGLGVAVGYAQGHRPRAAEEPEKCDREDCPSGRLRRAMRASLLTRNGPNLP